MESIVPNSPTLKIEQNGNQFRISLAVGHDMVSCTVSVALEGGPDHRTDAERRSFALGRANGLAKALHTAIEEARNAPRT